MPEFLTVSEVSAVMHAHTETVRRWLRKDLFPNAVKTPSGYGWRIPRSDVEALQRTNEVSATEMAHVGGNVSVSHSAELPGKSQETIARGEAIQRAAYAVSQAQAIDTRQLAAPYEQMMSQISVAANVATAGIRELMRNRTSTLQNMFSDMPTISSLVAEQTQALKTAADVSLIQSDLSASFSLRGRLVTDVIEAYQTAASVPAIDLTWINLAALPPAWHQNPELAKWLSDGDTRRALAYARLMPTTSMPESCREEVVETYKTGVTKKLSKYQVRESIERIVLSHYDANKSALARRLIGNLERSPHFEGKSNLLSDVLKAHTRRLDTITTYPVTVLVEAVSVRFIRLHVNDLRAGGYLEDNVQEYVDERDQEKKRAGKVLSPNDERSLVGEIDKALSSNPKQREMKIALQTIFDATAATPHSLDILTAIEYIENTMYASYDYNEFNVDPAKYPFVNRQLLTHEGVDGSRIDTLRCLFILELLNDLFFDFDKRLSEMESVATFED